MTIRRTFVHSPDEGGIVGMSRTYDMIADSLGELIEDMETCGGENLKQETVSLHTPKEAGFNVDAGDACESRVLVGSIMAGA